MMANLKNVHMRMCLVVAIGAGMLTACDNGGGGGQSTSGAVPPTITATALPLADEQMPYEVTLSATGAPAIKWSISSGSLAPGLMLQETGLLQGTPSATGNWPLAITVTNPAGTDTRAFMLTVRPRTTRVSNGTSGIQGNGPSGVYPTYGGESGLSADGRYVVFQSSASNLVSGDSNGKRDFFLQDRSSGELSRVSIGNGGTQADGDTVAGAISGDGNIVAFHSFASNLVLGDTNAGAPGGGGGDVFVYDRVKGETSRVSVGSLSGQEGTCSVAPAAGLACTSFDPQLSFDGNLVVFGSTFANLVPGDSNSVADVFIHDRTSKLTERVSVGPAGLQADGGSGNPGVSADGRYVVFESTATNLLGPGMDINGASDIFVYDRTTRQTVRVSVDAAGAAGNWHSFTPSISADGRYVAFWSVADNLVANDTNGRADVFVVDWQSPTPNIRRVSVGPTGIEGNGDSRVPVLSRDGRYVVFESEASNLLDHGSDSNGDTDVFVVDLQAPPGTALKRASVDALGAEAVGGPSETPSISADGRFISLTSGASNLVPGDTNGVADVFIVQRP